MKKYILLSFLAFILLLGIGVYQYFLFHDGRLHVVFCDVGQGDAIFIRAPNNKYILVDGGPDKKVLDCLAKHMGFWERTIDLVVLTHPHQDHFFGLNYVLDRYITLSFATERLNNNTGSYRDLNRKIGEKKIAQRTVFAGDRYRIGEDLFIAIESPSHQLLQRSSPNGVIGESREFASIILKLTYGNFDVIFTGDAQAEALGEVASENQNKIEVLQVPHHGSKTGLNRGIIEQLAPELAVISVGAKNRYGHPSKAALSLFDEKRIKILRTDRDGDVEILSDGMSFWIK